MPRWPSLFDRLFDNTIILDNDCWEYTGARCTAGYGQIRHEGKSLLTHRVSYDLVVGDIPPKMMVCHKCDYRPCINPDHLFLGTMKDNKHDSMAKDRHARGERVGHSKLTEQIVREIRQLLDEGIPAPEIALRYGVSRSTPNSIKLGITWGHLS